MCERMLSGAARRSRGGRAQTLVLSTSDALTGASVGKSTEQ